MNYTWNLNSVTTMSGSTTWSTTSNTAGTANITFPAFSASTSTVTGMGAVILPLRPPALESQPGWLSPEGNYYAVNYIQMQRHPETATAIINELMPELMGGLDAQTILMESGWIRVDYDSILPQNPKTTRDQRDTLRKLIQLDGDENWRKTCELINLFCFKQTRRKKKAA